LQFLMLIYFAIMDFSGGMHSNEYLYSSQQNQTMNVDGNNGDSRCSKRLYQRLFLVHRHITAFIHVKMKVLITHYIILLKCSIQS